MTETIQIRGRTITYELIRKKVKNINLHVKADGRIIISASNRVSKKYIEDFIVQKADWIEKSLERFEDREPDSKKEFEPVEGSIIRLLGMEYKIHITGSTINHIELTDAGIRIQTKHPEDESKIRSLWEKWYKEFIKGVFYQVVKAIHPKFLPYRIPMPDIKIRKMKARWGSCAVYDSQITLNTALIHAPLSCIEYVAAHELTHFTHPNHSGRFYAMLASIMPDYKERKKLLEQQGIYY
jgi:predicted metal-dependent hydrolase